MDLFIYYAYVLLPIMLAVIVRTAGGGYIADKIPSMAPEIVFGLIVGACFGHNTYLLTQAFAPSYVAWLPWLAYGLGTISAANAYRSIERGHGNAYHMGYLYNIPGYAPRFQKLDVWVFPICKVIAWIGKRFGKTLDIASRSPIYCWVFMILKGTLIGLSLLPFGIFLGIYWAQSYEYSFRKTRDSELAEPRTGFATGWFLIINHLFVLAVIKHFA